MYKTLIMYNVEKCVDYFCIPHNGAGFRALYDDSKMSVDYLLVNVQNFAAKGDQVTAASY